MEREIVELRKQLESQQSSPGMQQGASPFDVEIIHSSLSPTMPQMLPSVDQFVGSQEAVASASLLDLKSGLDGGSFLRSPSGQLIPPRRLEDVVLHPDRVQELFHV